MNENLSWDEYEAGIKSEFDKNYTKGEGEGEEEQQNLAFARMTQEGQVFWPAMIEKAFAKVHGDQAAIISGSAGQSFKNILGCPIMTIQTVEKRNGEIAFTESELLKE